MLHKINLQFCLFLIIFKQGTDKKSEFYIFPGREIDMKLIVRMYLFYFYMFSSSGEFWAEGGS